MSFAYVFELLPVALAIAAAISCGTAYKSASGQKSKLVLGLGIVCAVLLICAQSSWWGSFVLLGTLEGTVWANYIWTVFNSLVMLAFIAYSRHA